MQFEEEATGLSQHSTIPIILGAEHIPRGIDECVFQVDVECEPRLLSETCSVIKI